MLIFNKLWYAKTRLRWLLWPLSVIYKIIINIRRLYLIVFKQQHFNIPIIVVGNLTVGGTGKTPLVIALCRQLSKNNVRVGVVSRGYRAKLNKKIHLVSLTDQPTLVGDEPLLIRKKTGCPVVIARKRNNAVKYLLNHRDCQVIISDDGLQHYALGRRIEIAVIDGIRQFGNGLCFPAGPLREPISRLKKCHFIVIKQIKDANNYNLLTDFPTSYFMTFKPGKITNLKTGLTRLPQSFPTPIAAVAGIGCPEHFFTTLADLGIKHQKYPFVDHYCFKATDLQFIEKTIIMTEKDAIKCQTFAANSWYFLPIEAQLSETFWQALWVQLEIK